MVAVGRCADMVVRVVVSLRPLPVEVQVIDVVLVNHCVMGVRFLIMILAVIVIIGQGVIQNVVMVQQGGGIGHGIIASEDVVRIIWVKNKNS